MPLPRHLIPEQLRTLAEHIGEDAMLKLLEAYGGVHLAVPTLARIPAGHRLVEILGSQALTLCHHYGGSVISVPKAHVAALAMRNRRIRTARAMGYSHASLAREYGLTERQIYNICAADMTDIDHGRPDQQDLFE